MLMTSNNTAGIVTISDLPNKALIEIRDMAGKLLRSIRTITPSYSMDSENWNNGTYLIVAKSSEEHESFKLDIHR
jgi:hypothetical protein